MLLLRLLGALAVLTIAICTVAYFLTGNRSYLRLGWNILKYSLLAALGVAALILLEHLFFNA